MKVISLAGARPNFMKVAPIVQALHAKQLELQKSATQKQIQSILVHSGQHYDDTMSTVFFQDLNIPEPQINLEVGSGTHAEQTAKVMIAFEKVCLTEDPDVIIVVGDVNTTLAGSLVAAKLRIPLAHVEAGLRSFDRTMPEEINRVLSDSIADLLFITEKDAEANLLREGASPGKIFYVGNVMIDSLQRVSEKLINEDVLTRHDVEKSDYALITLHRPETVDEERTFSNILKVLCNLQERIPLIFPVHPRTKARLQQTGLFNSLHDCKNLRIVDPLGYVEFVSLMKFARFVLTDSGGIQEETTALQIPCITVRRTTERPVTVTEGTNVVAGLDPNAILQYCEKAMNGDWKTGSLPALWDGKASERIVNVICQKYL